MSALPVLLLACLVSAAPRQDAPDRKEVDALVEEYLALDWKRPADIERQRAILVRLEALPPLDRSKAKAWRKKLLKLWEQGPELPKRGSRHHLWEEEERGFFILGGKTKKPKGLFVGMHGGGVGQGDANTSAGAFDSAASAFKWAAIFPEVLEKTERGWTDAGTEEFVLELIERARRTYGVDPDRVFLGGHSMGGYGSWTLGAHHADVVAGLTPSAGAPTPILEGDGRIVDVVEGVIPSLRNVPMVIYQSIDDPRVPPDVNQFAVKLLKEARERWGGYDFEYWEVDGHGHDLPPGGTRALLEKIADRERNAHPDRVVWQPVLDWKRQFYWLFWDEPVRNALVVADLDREANAVDVTTEARTEGLWVLLSDDVVDLDEEVVVRLNGEERFRGVPDRDLATLVLTGRHGDPQRTYDARVPLF